MNELSEGKLVVAKSSETSEWPEKVKRGFQHFVESADDQPFSVVCAVGVSHDSRNISVQFSPNSSENPHLSEMCSDLSELFKMLAKRFSQ